MIRTEKREVTLDDWDTIVPARTRAGKGRRYGHLTVRRRQDGVRLVEALILDPLSECAEVVCAPLPPACQEFPSLTPSLPAAHWAERLIGDFWGLKARGHQRWKSLALHEAWPATEFPFAVVSDLPLRPREYQFMKVEGPGIHEIPVGPIHAGIIEAGHFRFSCLGEVITNLEIRLGYQHRGVESRLTSTPLQHMRHVAESVSSDSGTANAIAHAEAIENLFGIEPSSAARSIRRMALEIERIASHLGDLGGLSGDVGFALGAAAFARLRGVALGLGQTLGGSRFQRGLVCPGGIAWRVEDERFSVLAESARSLRESVREASDLMLQNPGLQERMEGVGALAPHLVTEFGMVGPTSRASGGNYDARSIQLSAAGLAPATESAGDVLSRARVRAKEIETSLDLLQYHLSSDLDGPPRVELPERLPACRVGVGVVEAWRGELIHWVTTNEDGSVNRYCVRDPSLQNWTGLAIAARHNLVADFPVINKSFGLSYSGNDL